MVAVAAGRFSAEGFTTQGTLQRTLEMSAIIGRFEVCAPRALQSTQNASRDQENAGRACLFTRVLGVEACYLRRTLQQAKDADSQLRRSQ